MARRRNRMPILLPLMCAAALALPLHAQAPASASVDGVQRETVGNRSTEGIPAIPAELVERLQRYQNTRGAGLAGWTADGCLLVTTRFAETSQVHRVCQPLGMREQLTFYPEPVGGVVPAPIGAPRDGFVFAKDRGGDEFSQLYWFDATTREATLLSDGRRSQNGGTAFNHDGSLMAYSGTGRNGRDRDIYVRDMRSGQARRVLETEGSWTPLDFSPDGRELIVMRYLSIADARPGVVDLASGKLTMFPIDGGSAAFGRFAYAPDGSVYFISDEPLDGAVQEFRSLRRHDPATGAAVRVGPRIDWDVDDFVLSGDGTKLAYSSNEHGFSKLRLLALPEGRELPLPALPAGVIGDMAFSADGKRLAFSINGATSPSDVHVIDLAAGSVVQWTRGEIGGLDVASFIEPTLVEFPTFDTAGGKPRMIPAFYYRPRTASPERKAPVVMWVHGGPESQSRPSFHPMAQLLANELGIAMLVPNVRGSSGYGKTWLALDNADKREDSVRDIGALLDWIASQPELDATRVGVRGQSYGGYMSLATLQHYGDRVRAGIEFYGISDFVTFLENTEDYRRDLRRAEYGDERDPAMQAVFERISPLRNAHRIKSALFVAQGKNDPRVPWTEAEQIVKAARANGGPVWYLLYDDEGHGFRKKGNSDYFNAASMQFWQTYLLKD